MKNEILQRIFVELIETREPRFRETLRKVSNDKKPIEQRKLKIEKELKQLLYTLIDPTSALILKKADYTIKKISYKLLRNGGWYTSSESIIAYDLVEETENAFFKEQQPLIPIYHIIRDENGFHPQVELPEDSIYSSIRRTETQFCETNKEKLTILDSMYTAKEVIMSGNYQTKPEYQDLVELICEYFGYEKQRVYTK